MNNYTKVFKQGYVGMFVLAQITKNLDHDDLTGDTKAVYYDKKQTGFILEVSEYFKDYYLIRYFTGETVWHWGYDLFMKKDLDKSCERETF